jgi:hypothetical protein
MFYKFIKGFTIAVILMSLFIGLFAALCYIVPYLVSTFGVVSIYIFFMIFVSVSIGLINAID